MKCLLCARAYFNERDGDIRQTTYFQDLSCSKSHWKDSQAVVVNA